MSRQAQHTRSDESKHDDHDHHESGPKTKSYAYSSMSESFYDGKTLKQRGFQDEYVDDGNPKHTRSFHRHFRAGDIAEDERINVDLQSNEAEYHVTRKIKDQVVETCKKGRLSGDLLDFEEDPLRRITFDQSDKEKVNAKNVDDPQTFQKRFEEQKQQCMSSKNQSDWKSTTSGDQQQQQQGQIQHQTHDRA